MVNMHNPFRRDHPALDGLKKFDDPNGPNAEEILAAKRAENDVMRTATQAARVAFLETQASKPYVHNSDAQAAAQNAVTEELPATANPDGTVDQAGIKTLEQV